MPTAEQLCRCQLIAYLFFSFSVSPKVLELIVLTLVQGCSLGFAEFQSWLQTNKIPFFQKCVIFDWDTCLFLLFWWVVALFPLGLLICFFVCCTERQMSIYSQDKILVWCLENAVPKLKSWIFCLFGFMGIVRLQVWAFRPETELRPGAICLFRERKVKSRDRGKTL